MLLLRTAVLIVILIEPMAGLFVALLTGPLGAIEMGLLDSGQLYLLLSLLSWLAHGLRDRRLFVPRTFLAVPLALFVGVTAVSILDAPSYNFALRELLKWIEMLAIMLLVVDRVQVWRVRRGGNLATTLLWLLGALFAAGVSQALLGIYQFALQPDGPEHFLVLGRFYRAYGTFNQPNPFGAFVNFTAVLGLGMVVGYLLDYFETRDWRLEIFSPQSPVSSLKFWVLVLVTGLALAAVVASWSRGRG